MSIHVYVCQGIDFSYVSMFCDLILERSNSVVFYLLVHAYKIFEFKF
jgi:hypothetical protein